MAGKEEDREKKKPEEGKAEDNTKEVKEAKEEKTSEDGKSKTKAGKEEAKTESKKDSKSGKEEKGKKAKKKADEKPKEEKKNEKKKGEKVDVVSEDIYTIPLSKVYRTKPNYKRTNKAVRMLTQYLKRHTKSEDIVIDGQLNRHIWSRGSKKPPRRVQVKAVKDSEGRITATLLK